MVSPQREAREKISPAAGGGKGERVVPARAAAGSSMKKDVPDIIASVTAITCDVPTHALVGGVPAKIIRHNVQWN